MTAIVLLIGAGVFFPHDFPSIALCEQAWRDITQEAPYMAQQVHKCMAVRVR